MALLVLGANGLLGSNVVEQAVGAGTDVTAAYHSERPDLRADTLRLDVTDGDRLEDAFDAVAPDAVVNCAALTDVDACETDPERATAVNGDAPGVVAELAARHGADLVHVSTDYVFDGTTDGRYAERDSPNPLQVYGETKHRGEQRVRSVHPEALIPRLSFVYGRHGATGDLEGFPAWVRERLGAGETVPAFTDQWVTPTRAGQAAATILSALSVDASGPLHVACRDCATPYDIAETVAAIEGDDSASVRESRTADVDRAAPRPTRTCLDVRRVERLLGREQPTLEADLRRAL